MECALLTLALLIKFVIQHHPDRAHLLRKFEHLDPIVVTDPEPEARLRIPWRTYHACLSLEIPEANWRVVLQDDVDLCPGFHEAVREALSYAGGRPTCLFVPRTLRFGSVKLLQACSKDLAWCDLHVTEWVPVVAIAWPETVVPEFLSWAAGRGFTPNKNRADDAIVGRFARETRQPFQATVPSLVEHPDTVPSLIKNHIPKNGRRATCYVGDFVHEVDWSRR